MQKKHLKKEIQCAKCPWRVDTNPYNIPDGYSVELHKQLEKTIAPSNTLKQIESPTLAAMACHESHPSEEVYCIGWLINQLGEGNNIALRIEMFNYDLSKVQTIGEQHQRFEDTLPPE